MLARVSSAQSTGENVSPVVVIIASTVGAVGVFISLCLIIEHIRKQYEVWRDASAAVERDEAIESLNLHYNRDLIPFSDIEFQGADLYRLLYHDDIQATPRSFESKELKR